MIGCKIFDKCIIHFELLTIHKLFEFTVRNIFYSSVPKISFPAFTVDSSQIWSVCTILPADPSQTEGEGECGETCGGIHVDNLLHHQPSHFLQLYKRVHTRVQAHVHEGIAYA